jgi:hypothetical protein
MVLNARLRSRVDWLDVLPRLFSYITQRVFKFLAVMLVWNGCIGMGTSMWNGLIRKYD